MNKLLLISFKLFKMSKLKNIVKMIVSVNR